MQATARINESLLEQQPLELWVTELHDQDMAFLTEAIDISLNQIVLRRSPARTAVGRHVWLELALPTGPIKVLARVVGRSLETTTYRIKHMWPSERHLYQNFLAS